MKDMQCIVTYGIKRIPRTKRVTVFYRNLCLMYYTRDILFLFFFVFGVYVKHKH